MITLWVSLESWWLVLWASLPALVLVESGMTCRVSCLRLRWHIVFNKKANKTTHPHKLLILIICFSIRKTKIFNYSKIKRHFGGWFSPSTLNFMRTDSIFNYGRHEQIPPIVIFRAAPVSSLCWQHKYHLEWRIISSSTGHQKQDSLTLYWI